MILNIRIGATSIFLALYRVKCKSIIYHEYMKKWYLSYFHIYIKILLICGKNIVEVLVHNRPK